MKRNFKQFITCTPSLGDNVYIAPHATVIGAVTLGHDTSVWPGAVVRADMHTIIIAHSTNIQDNAVLHVTHMSEYNPHGYPVVIGKEVTIGHGAVLHGCTLKDRILVGMGATIMDGATIESDTFIAAGSLITSHKRMKSGFLYSGRPAKLVRKLTPQELDFIRYSAQNYIVLKNEYLMLE